MTEAFLEDLRRRGAAAGVEIPEILGASLGRYFELLAVWNDKVNLTGFSLGSPTDAAIDRLFIEPLIASRAVTRPVAAMVDLGSGGGSPGIPMALALTPERTVLVEAKVRKSVFLKEVARELGITNRVDIQTARFETLSTNPAFSGAFDLATVRAVRVGAPESRVVSMFLRPGGQMLVFHAADKPPTGIGDEFRFLEIIPLETGGGVISVMVRV